MSSNDSTCYLWFSKCLYLWFEIILEIIFYLKLLLYAENVLTFLCRAFAESFVTFVTARSFSSPMQRRTTPWVFRVSTAHHIPAIPATRQPKASTDRWSDGPISSVSYHQLPHPDGLAFNQRGIVGGHHKDHGGIHSLDVLKYMVLLCLNYIVLRWTILLPHCPSHKLGSKKCLSYIEQDIIENLRCLYLRSLAELRCINFPHVIEPLRRPPTCRGNAVLDACLS